MTLQEFTKHLEDYIPEKAISQVFDLIKSYKIHLKITKQRKSKYGDYKPPFQENPHTISVNGNLNKYAFLITFIHEVAHLQVHVNYKRRVASHGKEWKKQFSQTMRPFLIPEIFPPSVLVPLQKHMENPMASSGSDPLLYLALKNVDKKSTNPTLNEITEGNSFNFEGKTYIKGKKRRTRILCYLQPTNKPYIFTPFVEVEIVHSLKSISNTESQLNLAQKNLDPDSNSHFLNEIDEGDVFLFENNTYVKGKKKRTRILCYLQPKNKPYIFQPYVLVEVIKSSTK